MEFIDKRPFLEQEQKLDVKFLKDCYKEDTQSFYPSVDTDQSYSNFSSKKYRKGIDGWESLLLQEQHGRCCYCMRRLKNTALNIEHVIPRNLKDNDPHVEFAKYTESSKWLADNVELDSDFAERDFKTVQDIDNVKIFPHRIALANLLASCNGKFEEVSSGCCCNNARSNDYLQPLMLMPEVKERIIYNGISGAVVIYPQDESWVKMLQTLNDDTYKEIRILWYRICKFSQKLDLEIVRSYLLKDRIMFFKKIFNQNNFEDIPNEYHKYTGLPDGNSTYWNLLMDFDWFYTYWRCRS